MGKKIIIIASLILLLIIIVFVDKKTNIETTVVEEVDVQAEMEILSVKHQYKDGKHIFIGEIELPSSCYSYNAVVEETDDSKVKNLIVRYENSTDENQMCAQVITPVTFRAVYAGDKDVEFKAFVNDEEYRLNTFEIPENVDIAEFELFIKG